ncbi:hypothetical protein [Paraburkholderia heleia]|uniref:hypothetical protein n=1 Tax=Paraburkholderia heleia TaxID=634127 RepID=UPI002AB6403C|nr:hypothetical protein [Paraburkholderia heleia]
MDNDAKHFAEQTQLVVDTQTLKRALGETVEDFQNLGNVLSWMAEIFFHIGERCVDKSPTSTGIFSIEKMAEMGRYLAESWADTARCMESTARDAMTDTTEAHHA